MVHRCSWLHRSWSREYIAASSDGQVSAFANGRSKAIKGTLQQLPQQIPLRVSTDNTSRLVAGGYVQVSP